MRSKQEYTHVALGGIIRDASTGPDGVREITDFEVHEASLVSARQAMHPSPKRCGIDECKEMSPQDFENITEVLRDRAELQGGIQTDKSDWLREVVQ